MTTATKAFFTVVVVAAGASGVALVLFPGSTGSYFSWTLRPPAAAALIGGFYLASAFAFAAGLRMPWRQARSLMVAVLGLAVPTLVLTIVHDEVFDFGRWQAMAWAALFVIAPIGASAILLTTPREPAAGSRLAGWARAVLGLLGVALAAAAVLIWLDTTREDVLRFSPVDLVRLTGTYLGAWCSFLALLTGMAAVRGTWDEARLALLTLAAAGGGATLALARSAGDVRHLGPSLAVSLGLAALALGTYRACAPARAGTPESARAVAEPPPSA